MVLIEAGRPLRAGVDYNTHLQAREVLEKRLQSTGRFCEPRLKMEKDHFTPMGDRPGHGWVKAPGGRSLCWAGHSLRFGTIDFRRAPISYDKVTPYYSRAEPFMGVYGHKDGLPNLPDGEFLKPVRMRCPEMVLKRPSLDGTYQVQCDAGLQPGLVVKDIDGFGSSLKRTLRERNVGRAVMNMQGLLSISPKKFINLDPDRRDRYGLNLAPIHLHYEQNEIATAKDIVETCKEVIHAAGGEVPHAPPSVTADSLQIDSNHWVGTTRMGLDPKTSVVNLSCQSHEILIFSLEMLRCPQPIRKRIPH